MKKILTIMKKLSLIAFLLAFCFVSFSLFGHENKLYSEIQQAKAKNLFFENATLQRVNPNAEILKNFINPAEVYFFENFSLDLKNNPVKAMDLLLPLNNENMMLELIEVPEDFYNYVVTTSEGETFAANKAIKHYRGIVKGDIHSTVVITFYEDEIMGLICTDEGNFNIVKETQSNKYMLYNDKNLKEKSSFSCGNTDDFIHPYDPEVLFGERNADVLDKKVRFYVETEYDIFQNKGSVAAVETYITFIFSQVYVLYLNEEIKTEISELYVWTTTDPFTGGDTDALLTQFKNNKTSINGDLGILLTFRNVGGGQAAGFNGLCNSSVKESLAVAMIDNSCSTVPTYSWTVMVCTHELGHLFGSRHTHACVWNGNNTAIDGCYNVEGSCSKPSIPSGGGTIMSYCHLQSVGIKFNLGFGPQPGNVIRNRVTNAPCLLLDLPNTITFESLVINDSEENNNGRLNPGETVHLTVSMKNLTDQPVNNVRVKFTTSDEFVTIVNGEANYGNFAANEIKTIENAFTITLSKNATNQHEIAVVLEAISNGNTEKSPVTITVYDYTLKLLDIKISNENGEIAPGETSDVNIYLKNIGDEPASNLKVELTTSSSYLTINEGTAYYGQLNATQYKYRTYNVTLSPNTPAGTKYVTVTLIITDEFGRITKFVALLNFKNVGEAPQVCAPIKDLSAQIVDPDIIFTWSAPSEGTPEKYLIYCNDKLLGETTNLTYTIADAKIGIHHFSVEALYADGCTSEAACVEAVIPCLSVELSLVQEEKSFLLSWLPVQENVTYLLYKNSNFLVEVEGNEYIDSEIEEDVMYCYNVILICPDNLEAEPSNEACETMVGINELQNNVKIAPNPTTGELRITSDALHITNVEVFDIYGRKTISDIRLSDIRYSTSEVGKSEIGKSEIEINISHLSSGIYFIRVQTENGTIMRKVVKQ